MEVERSSGDGAREQRTENSPAVGFVVVGLGASLAGLAALGTIGYWYAVDMGWTGSGSTIVESRAPIISAALVPAALTLFGLMTFLVRHDVPATSARGLALLAVNLLMGASVWLAVGAYPQVEQAEMAAIGADGTTRWRIELPVTEVFGLREETEHTITVEGRADRRGCAPQHRSVKFDRSTGEVLAVEVLPTVYDDPSRVPSPPTPLEQRRGGFDVRQGSAPFICRN
jgi:hypothetical protein